MFKNNVNYVNGMNCTHCLWLSNGCKGAPKTHGPTCAQTKSNQDFLNCPFNMASGCIYVDVCLCSGGSYSSGIKYFWIVIYFFLWKDTMNSFFFSNKRWWHYNTKYKCILVYADGYVLC